MHMGGYLVREIAEETKLSERTVKRILHKASELYVQVTGLPLNTPPAEA